MMQIKSFYKFKLTDKHNGIYRFKGKSKSYSNLNDSKELQLRKGKSKGSIELFRLIDNKNFTAQLTLYNQKFGMASMPDNDDLLLIIKSNDKIGLLKIFVLENMKPYVGIIYQEFLNGYFNDQIKALRSSIIH